MAREPRRALTLGEHTPITTTPLQLKDGKWVKVRRDRRTRTDVWRARARYMDHSGQRGEVSHRAQTEAEAVAKVEQTLRERLYAGDAGVVSDMALTAACERWLADLERSDSGRSARTVAEYRGAYERSVRGVERDNRGHVLGEHATPLSGLTLGQANDVQRLTRFLRQVADERGTASVKHVRAVLSGVLSEAVRAGVLPRNAMRDVPAVKANVQRERTTERDTTRAFTLEERQDVLDFADAWADEPVAHPATADQRRALADLAWMLAGTGMRIGEALALRWQHIDLTTGETNVPGTKSASSRRVVTLPPWLLTAMLRRAEQVGTQGYVFASPRLRDRETPWDPANCSRGLTTMLSEAGYPWARSHTFRKTVASILSASGVDLARIADQLGHADPSMTASVYLGRSWTGNKADLAAIL